MILPSTREASIQQFVSCCTRRSFQTFHVILGLALQFIEPNAAIVAAVDDPLTRQTGKRPGAPGGRRDAS